MANEVKYIHSGLRAAPALSGTAGQLLTVMEAWRTGFGATTAVSCTVAAGIATITVPGGETFAPNTTVEVSGATSLAAVNGLQRVLASPNSSTFTFATTAPDGTPGGTISVRVAPSGWNKPFSGTNTAAYKPSTLDATGHVARLDDTGATNARVRGFESMTTINDGLGLIPLDSQVSGGLWWPKSAGANGTARPWFIVSDDRGFYIGTDPGGLGKYVLMYIGDFKSERSGDAYSFIATGNVSDLANSTTVPQGCVGYSGRTSRDGAYISRSHTRMASAVQAQRIGLGHNGPTADQYSGGAGYSLAGSGPNGPNNGMPVCAVELIVQGQRGVLPGLYHLRNDWAAGLAHGAVIDGTDDMLGRKLLVVRVGPTSGAVAGTALLDITGPWVR